MNSTILKEKLMQEPTLIDVRTPEEFATGSVPGAINIPLHLLEFRLPEIKDKKNIIVFCKSGARSYQASMMMQQHGLQDVINGGPWDDVYELSKSIQK